MASDILVRTWPPPGASILSRMGKTGSSEPNDDKARSHPVAARPSSSRRLLASLAIGGLLLVGLQALFFFLNLAAATVPEQRIAQMLVEDIHSGAYPDTNSRLNGVGGRFDLFTDCVVAGTGIGNAGLGPLERSLLMPRITPCVGGEEIIPLIARGEYITTSSYLRYWAGYTFITKPALALAGMDGMRIVGALVLSGGLAAVLLVGTRRLGIWCSALLVLPLLASADLAVVASGSALHSMMLGVAFAGAALVLSATARSGLAVMLASLAAGSIYCFMDLLSNPPLAWLFATALATAGGFVAAGVPRALKLGMIAAVAWISGFALTWLVRWLLAALAFGVDVVLDEVGKKALERMSGEHKQVSSDFGAGTIRNLQTWSDMPLATSVAIFGAAALIVLLVLTVRAQGLKAVGAWALLVAPVLIVPLWYEALSNHSQVHTFFTYRAVPAAVGWALASAALMVTGGQVGRHVTRSGARRGDPGTNSVGSRSRV